jgi:hypothetical protein
VVLVGGPLVVAAEVSLEFEQPASASELRIAPVSMDVPRRRRRTAVSWL